MNKEIMDVIRDGDIDIDAFFQSLPPEKQRHSESVAKIAAQLLQQIIAAAPPEQEALPPPAQFAQAALYHDIGLVLIPHRLLYKRDELTAAEFRVIQQHAAYGGSILDRLRKSQTDPERDAFWALAAEIAVGHHERWDGRGYPYGQLATAVPLTARIVSIADAFDDMIRGSCYRMALPEEYALLEINQNAGTQFDPSLSKLFNKHHASLLFESAEFAV